MILSLVGVIFNRLRMDKDPKRKKMSPEADGDLVAKNPASKQQLSVRAYLDQTVVPTLMNGMTALVKARPEDQDPLVWLGNWLIEHAKNKNSGAVPGSADKPKKTAHKEEKAAPTTTTTTTSNASQAPAAATTTTTTAPATTISQPAESAAEEKSTPAPAAAEASS